jgi:hypothetical protein
MEQMGYGWLGHHIHDYAAAVGHMVPSGWLGITEWFAKATMDGVFGLALGFVLIPVATKVIAPVVGMFGGEKAGY